MENNKDMVSDGSRAFPGRHKTARDAGFRLFRCDTVMNP